MKTVLLCLLLSCATVASAQKERAELRRIMQAYHDYNMFDGAVLVAHQGAIVYEDAFGPANREWNIANRPDTKFMIGSVSKPLTATLVMLQVQKGLVHLDSAIDKYLPEFRHKPAAKVTVRHLLSHTSGMANYDIIPDFFPRISRQHFSREDYLRVFVDSALLFAPGTRYAYSSWGYFTLGLLAERVSGKPYATLMQEEIFAPAGMSRSGSYDHKQIVPGRATGYDYSFGGFTSADFRDQSNTMGTGDIYSTVGDLYRFHVALQGNRLLRDDLKAAMFAPGMAPANYGFGWFNKQYKWSATDSAASNFHLGITDGFTAFFRRIPGSNTVVVILCNSSPTDFFGITSNLLKALHGDRVVLKQPLHKRLEQRIGIVGAEAAVNEYASLRADTAHYSADWISMNFLAQQLLDMHRPEDARFVAERNVTDYGDKDLVQLTMGHVYRALGRKEDAVLHYRKALAISPGLDEARNRLKELEGR